MLCRSIFEVEAQKEQLQKLDHIISSPHFWDDAAKAQKIQMKRGRIQEVLTRWESCAAELEEAGILLELAMEEEDAETIREVGQSLEKLEHLAVSLGLTAGS